MAAGKPINPLFRAFASALAPGLGQIINRQALKGAALLVSISLWFAVTLALAVYKLGQARQAALSALGPGATDQAVEAELNAQLAAQGAGWLTIMLLLYIALAGTAAWDAWRTARRLAAAQDK